MNVIKAKTTSAPSASMPPPSPSREAAPVSHGCKHSNAMPKSSKEIKTLFAEFKIPFARLEPFSPEVQAFLDRVEKEVEENLKKKEKETSKMLGHEVKESKDNEEDDKGEAKSKGKAEAGDSSEPKKSDANEASGNEDGNTGKSSDEDSESDEEEFNNVMHAEDSNDSLFKFDSAISSDADASDTSSYKYTPDDVSDDDDDEWADLSDQFKPEGSPFKCVAKESSSSEKESSDEYDSDDCSEMERQLAIDMVMGPPIIKRKRYE